MEDNDAVVVSSIGVFMLMLLITRRLYLLFGAEAGSRHPKLPSRII